jgi:rhodanese-related sulfurtransferase
MEIDVEDLKSGQIGDKKIAVLDIRDPWEIEICALPDSINVPMAVLPNRIDTLPRDAVLAVICHHGMRSLHAAAWLRKHGFDDAVSLRGGIDAWARRVDRNMATY